MPEPMPGGGQRDQTKFIVFENFEKMNTQSVRQSLSEKELAWDENLQPIAPNNYVTVPAPSATPLATLTETIVLEFYASIGGNDYFFCFTTAGAGYFVNISTGVIGQFAPDGTFSNAPDLTTWQASRVLINDSKAGYSTFDGTLFVGQGGVSPNVTVTNGGSGYGAAPTVTISGGSGTGAAGVAVVSNGSVVAVNLTNPGHGYQPGDTLTVAFGTSPGSGAAGHVTMTGAPVTSVLLFSVGDFGGVAVGTHALTFSGGSGTGAAGFAVVVAAGFGLNKVASVTLTSPGSGYTSAPTVTLSGATFQPPGIGATIGTESVATIVLDAGGTLYTAPPAVAIVPPDGLGSGASAVATESGGSVTSLALVASALAGLALAVQGVATSSAGVYALSFSGGGGTGAAGTATIGNYTNNTGGTSLGVTSVILSSFGSGYTTAPTVTVGGGATFSTAPTILAFTVSQGGGYDTTANVIIGSGSGATAIAHVWPFVPAGTTLAVFQGRVWLNGLNTVSNEYNILQWTGTGATYGNVGYDDFLAADASGSLILSDSDLIHAITALRSLNNYLFIMGDQSVKQIGNISLNSAGNVTLFTILTLSSDQGTIYPKSCISYNRVFMFANSNGIYGVFGSSVQKLSSDMDGIWKLVDFSQQPQGALADINAIHNAVFLIRYKDPLASTRSIMLAFDGKRWFVLAQGNGMTAFATSASLTTGQNSLYGSITGNDLTQLFASPTTAVTFKWQSALTHHGNAVQGKKTIRAGIALSLATGTGTITMTADNETGSQSATFNLVAGFQKPFKSIESSGHYLGQTVTGTLAGLTMTNMALEFQDTTLWV